jgi:DNA helicase HerA-like ATPase
MSDMTRVLGEVDRIARRGRNFGFRLISITQRPAKLHKDVLTQLSTLVGLGVTRPQDRDAVKAWVDGNADREQARVVYDSLAKLPVGEGWVWAPDTTFSSG